jgi:NDP-sugar pyrophosphorylase family protein
MLVSYKSDMIEAYLRDGREFGVNLHYINEDIPMGTAGSVKAAEKAIGSDNFLVIYGDVMMDMDLTQLCRFSNSVKGVGTIVVHPNTHPYDSDLIEIDNNNKVIAIHAKPHNENQYYQNLVNAGVYVFTNKIFEHIKPDIKSDFGRDIFTHLVSKGAELYGYRTAEYIKDMGTPERLEQVRADYKSDRVSRLI